MGPGLRRDLVWVAVIGRLAHRIYPIAAPQKVAPAGQEAPAQVLPAGWLGGSGGSGPAAR